MSEEIKFRHYFVDEAGDTTFFDKKGRIIVGQPGASKFFMLGVAQIGNPEQVTWELNTLRASLMTNPRFKNIPSMQPEVKKTAITFHAKDDHPKIREKVFELIQYFDIKVFIAIRSKAEIAESAKADFKRLGRKLEQNAIYDDLITRIFKNLLHKADIIQIAIARRGKAVREEALEQAINQAQKNFESKWKISSNSSIIIEPCYPSEVAGLQVIDYYLWAVQRCYERNDDQFFLPLANKYRLIMDLDDKRNKPYGEWYCDRNPLTLEKLKGARSK
ncbi:DUF3800 domain-containing protein [Chlorogloeopsis fritschii PCC 9212]|uniref:DUF3800 domain-containing protein n=1 Tax=Chlorogloeopsis fritschii PCC 6912 TaxID=211165 RepID=A0A433NMR1_CHLFR|nr:DUF3800 domain-containing protein [Chlorogloeopsis fritschii]RUR84493.1 hypothetical protein PCC6912_13880 [Chlorogloeopsis fritschii PCC 6912]